LLENGDGNVIIDADAALPTVMSPLSAFLSHASLEAGDNQAQAGQDAMQLMTVHSAKGLEFDAVFITGLEEGLFPHENSAQEDSGVEEERRLMYVAITRARQRLYLSFSQTRMLHGQTRYNMRSRFLEELPEESLKWLSPKFSRNGLAIKNRHGMMLLLQARIALHRISIRSRMRMHGVSVRASRILSLVKGDREYRRQRHECACAYQFR
jgi:ATP-dependent helicase/DNAse subunit B